MTGTTEGMLGGVVAVVVIAGGTIGPREGESGGVIGV